MSREPKTIGQLLQNWLIRNEMNVIDPLFVSVVDHAFENAADGHVPFVKRRATSATALATAGNDDAARVSTAI
jgi:hypothetical protein